jgi:hypothetical protein
MKASTLHTIDFDDYVASFQKMTDKQVWTLAVMAVAMAGHRAQTRQRDDVERVCIAFVEAMHTAVGTTELQFAEPSHDDDV